MAKKKKKSIAKELITSSRKKLITETIKNASNEDAESKSSFQQSVLKGNPKKSIKQAIANSIESDPKKIKEEIGKEEYKKRIQKAKLAQAVYTASPNKAIKGLILEPFRKEEERQKALNKEYRKERNNLMRRIAYFRKKGFEFDSDSIAPRLDGNAIPEDIQRLRELREKKLKNLATGFNPPTPKTEAESPIDISTITEPDGYDGIDYTDDMFENDPENYLDEDDFHPTFDDLVFNDDEPFFPELEERESPSERYYRENSDRPYGGDDATIDAGLAVLNNAWDMIRQQDSYLSVMPMREGNREIKEDATYQLSEMLSKAEDELGQEKLALILQKHAPEFNSAVEKALRWRDSNDVDLTRATTSYSLTQINNILFSYDPALLSEYSTGNAADL